ncbi:MAG: two pore domain potassium channel family protein [Cyanobacteria bacterium K_Offshore_surface_m2_239]|nr:two pore domain potassium channel family protein [Cyanobacteria bacterium K_Offshore_surface_m2_239]
MGDPFLRRLLWICLLVLGSGALPPSLARLTWLGYPLLCLELLNGLRQRPSWRRTWGKRVYQVMGLASMVAQVIWVFSPRSLLSTSLPLLVLFLMFMGWSLQRLLHRLAEESPPEGDLVAGALAGYLLLGISGGLLLTVIDSLVPGCFRDTATGALVDLPPLGSTLEATAIWDVNVQRINYFAFVSLTTVGYGDISPIQPVAQLASVSLSVLGPLYIAVVLGVVVSRLVEQRSRAEKKPDAPER